MNPEKLKKLQAQAAEIRIGGKGNELCCKTRKKCFWEILRIKCEI
jgi:hypothetical protein